MRIENMFLQRSIKGKKAKAVFYRAFNDIDIYVEDTSIGTRKLYSELFTRALGEIYRIETVFPLGDKLTVIKKCQEDQIDGGRLRLYIVDGDIDLLNGSNPQGLKRLFILKRYCVENYLVDEAAIIIVLNEEDLERKRADIEREFEFKKWALLTERELFDIFVLYAIVKQLGLGCVTVTFPIRRLLSSGDGILDPVKVLARKNEIEGKLLQIIDIEILKNKKEAICQKANDYPGSKIRFISGKHCLLPLILMRMRQITNIRADNAVIKQRLAMKCDVSELESAKDYIA